MAVTEDPINSPDDLTEVDPRPSNGAGQLPSVLDTIKQTRKRLAEAREVKLEIPGYDGLLFAKYHYIDGLYDELQKITRRAESSKNPHADVNAQADVLSLACKEILIRLPNDPDADDDGLVSIDKDEPARFDVHLAEILDIEATKARDVVFGVFQNKLAVAQQSNELMQWAASNQSDVNQDTVGESRGTIQSS